MKNKIFFAFACCIYCAPITAIAQSSSELSSLQELVETEFSKFKKASTVFNLKLNKVEFSNTEPSHNPTNNANLVINLRQINKYTSGESKLFKRLFVQYVLGHEMGHRIQAGGFRPEVLSNRTGERGVFLEANADILAGFFMNYIFTTSEVSNILARGENYDRISAERVESLYSVFSAVLSMNNKAIGSVTHPSNTQRLTALRQGLYLATANQYWALRQFASSQDADFQKLVEQKKEIADAIGKGLGYDPSNHSANSIFFWAHNEAIRIIHENNDLARGLIRYNDEINWNTNSTTPFVSFSYNVMNINTEKINFAGRTVSQIVLRNDADNLLKTAATDALEFNRNIAVNQTSSFQGQITWTADKDYMPRLIRPGDETSFYWVFSETPLPASKPAQTLDAEFSDWNQNSVADIVETIATIHSYKTGIQNFTTGIGLSSEKDANEVLTNDVSYESLINVGYPGSSEIKINYQTKTAELRFIAGAFEDLETAQSNFYSIINKLKEEAPYYNPHTVINLTNSSRIRFDENGLDALKIYVRKNYSEKDYEIEITMINSF